MTTETVTHLHQKRKPRQRKTFPQQLSKKLARALVDFENAVVDREHVRWNSDDFWNEPRAYETRNAKVRDAAVPVANVVVELGHVFAALALGHGAVADAGAALPAEGEAETTVP